jgi:hypothetical protein
MKTLKRKAIAAIIFSLLYLVCINPSSYSAGPIDISGTWDGAIAVPGTELGITIEFNRKDDSTFSGAIDIPLQGAQDLSLANILIAGTTISFDLPGVPGAPKFDGTIADDGQEIAGDFSQGGATFPFHLQRKNAGTLAKEADELAAGLAEVRAFIDSTREIWRVPGLALAIVKDGEVIFSEGFGFRNIRDSLPVTANTIFAIGSATKAFTTMTMAMLVSDGLLDWDEPVRTYLPT